MALGESRTLSELIPFLAQLIEGQDDEVVLGISQAAFLLVRDYYLTFQKKKEALIALTMYLQRLSTQVLHSIYLPLLAIQDSLITLQAISDIRAIIQTVYQCHRSVKAPSSEMAKKSIAYQ